MREFDLSMAERVTLQEACRIADRVDDLEAEVALHGVMIPGSRKQLIINPAIVEARQQQAQLSRLLGQLGYGSATDKEESAGEGLLSLASVRASRAANARWDRYRPVGGTPLTLDLDEPERNFDAS